MFPSDTDIDTKITLETEASPIPDDLPFHILLLGDWSGRESQAVNSELFDSNPIEIDRDNFEEVLQKLDVRLNLAFQGDGENVLSLRFTEFEDFHPDRIFQQLSLFANLRDVRRRLVNSQTFEDAAREVRSWLVQTDNEKDSEIKAREAETVQDESHSGDLLNQILGQADEMTSEARSQNTESSELSAFVKKLVKPYLIQTDTAEQSKLLMIVDEVISDLMRKILHHPQFQALESAWRGAFSLVRQVETDHELRIYLLDLSKNDLTASLKFSKDLTDSRLYQILSQPTGNASSDKFWAVVSANYTFSLNVDDAATLIRLAKIAVDTNTPVVSHIKPEIFGFESFAEVDASDRWNISEESREGKLWTMIRTIPEATHLALALPRTLARLPYGKSTEPIEAFYFEEFTKTPVQHENYLWTNPVFVCTLLIAKTFRQFGWNMSRNFFQDVEGLPVHFFQDELENKTKPCAEILMTQSNCERILEQGLMPLISFKGEDKIRLAGFQSIAYPPSLLKGRWS